MRELEIERNDRLEREIDERVNRLRNIDKQLRENKEKKDKMEEPTENENQWLGPSGREKFRQTNKTNKERKTGEERKITNHPRDTREGPTRGMGNGGDDPDPSDSGCNEPTDESDDDEEEEEIEEEEEEESEEEQQEPPPPTPEEEAVESFTSSMNIYVGYIGK